MRPPNSHRTPKGDLPFGFILSALVLTIPFILVCPARWQIPGAETVFAGLIALSSPRRSLNVDYIPLAIPGPL